MDERGLDRQGKGMIEKGKPAKKPGRRGARVTLGRAFLEICPENEVRKVRLLLATSLFQHPFCHSYGARGVSLFIALQS